MVRPIGSRGANGVHQLHHALGDLQLVFLWLWIELFRRVTVLRTLLRRPRDLDFTTHR